MERRKRIDGEDGKRNGEERQVPHKGLNLGGDGGVNPGKVLQEAGVTVCIVSPTCTQDGVYT